LAAATLSEQEDPMRERNRVEILFDSLEARPRCKFPAAAGHVEAPKDALGVYVIRNAEGIVVHVGRTTRARNGIHQRLRNHLAGKSSFVRSMLDGNGGLLRGSYTYQFLEVADARERALLEHLATGRHCPLYLGLSKESL
jgi:hypothetical protein